MADIRRIRTRHAIQEALLSLMAKKPFQEIGVAELTREAGISRSAFYAHFTNTHDVYTALVREFFQGIKPLKEQLKCPTCNCELESTPTTTTPFCVALRNDVRMKPLIDDPMFLPTMFDLAKQRIIPLHSNTYGELGISKEDAETLYRFQMTGCYAAATSSVGRADWEHKQQLIDAFIKGGRNAVAALAKAH